MLREPADVIVRYGDATREPIYDELATEVHRTMPHVLVAQLDFAKHRNELAAHAAHAPHTWLGKAVHEVQALPTTIFYLQTGEHAQFTGATKPSTFLQAVRDTYED